MFPLFSHSRFRIILLLDNCRNSSFSFRGFVISIKTGTFSETTRDKIKKFVLVNSEEFLQYLCRRIKTQKEIEERDKQHGADEWKRGIEYKDKTINGEFFSKIKRTSKLKTMIRSCIGNNKNRKRPLVRTYFGK